MKIAIDLGSNTVRMLIGDHLEGQIQPHRYYRAVTRLGGGYDPDIGITSEAAERTLVALEVFSSEICHLSPDPKRVVATEAVRRSVNGQQFVADVLARTGLVVEVIGGEEEALLSSSGVLAGLNPQPQACLIFDIGGGSTEFIVVERGKQIWQTSYPLGVVRLAEVSAPRMIIDEILSTLREDLRRARMLPLLTSEYCELVGTAGTVTTLAAIDLEMTEYDWQRINNHRLSISTVRALRRRLLPLTPLQREALTGVEPGRGDLIHHGADIVLSLLELFQKEQMRISDFGLLEGILLSIE